jgi:hypothetical protein
LRFDRGGEFISNEFEEFYETYGIKRHFFNHKNSTKEWSGRKKKINCIGDGKKNVE